MSNSQTTHTCINFRDLGGVEGSLGLVATGRIFRTAQLSDIDEASAIHLAETLGIRRYVDFREQTEVLRDGSPRPLMDRGVQWIRHPFDIGDEIFSALDQPNAADWEGLYTRALRRLRPRFAGAMQHLARGPGPVMFGCWVGKDRTGMVAALLLSILGVDDRAIAEDFARTTPNLALAKARFEWIWEKDPSRAEAIFSGFAVAAPESMLGLLHAVRTEFGTAQAALNLSDDTASALRRRFLEEPHGQ